MMIHTMNMRGWMWLIVLSLGKGLLVHHLLIWDWLVRMRWDRSSVCHRRWWGSTMHRWLLSRRWFPAISITNGCWLGLRSTGCGTSRRVLVVQHRTTTTLRHMINTCLSLVKSHTSTARSFSITGDMGFLAIDTGNRYHLPAGLSLFVQFRRRNPVDWSRCRRWLNVVVIIVIIHIGFCSML